MNWVFQFWIKDEIQLRPLFAMSLSEAQRSPFSPRAKTVGGFRKREATRPMMATIETMIIDR